MVRRTIIVPKWAVQDSNQIAQLQNQQYVGWISWPTAPPHAPPSRPLPPHYAGRGIWSSEASPGMARPAACAETEATRIRSAGYGVSDVTSWGQEC